MKVECDYLDLEGRCEGLYKGFGCIQDKCMQESKKRPAGCKHLRDDGYCLKLGKLHCSGESNCDSFE